MVDVSDLQDVGLLCDVMFRFQAPIAVVYGFVAMAVCEYTEIFLALLKIVIVILACITKLFNGSFNNYRCCYYPYLAVFCHACNVVLYFMSAIFIIMHIDIVFNLAIYQCLSILDSMCALFQIVQVCFTTFYIIRYTFASIQIQCKRMREVGYQGINEFHEDLIVNVDIQPDDPYAPGMT